jgi:sporulation protein YlmC with PRC-barrel domain
MKKLLIVILIGIVAGCDPTLKDVRKELGEGGFALWYPAESGVEPGQIWITNGKQKHIQQRRPNELNLLGPSRVKFKSLTKTVDADTSLNAAFAEGILGEAEDLAVLLKNATVKEVKLNFGETYVSRLVLGDLSDPKIKEQLSKGYLTDLENVKKLDQYVLITAVVTSSGMKYTFECEDTKQLEVKAPEISEIIKAEFNLKIESNTTATWEIPETDVLAIGITPVSGEIVQLRPKDAESRTLKIEKALLKLKSQDIKLIPGQKQ